MTLRYGEVRGDLDIEDLGVLAAEPAATLPSLPRRIDLDPEKVERGMAQLVLSLVELIRQLLEKQALRRIDSGELTAGQVDRLGTTLMRLEQQMQQLKAHFELDSLDLDLGPLGHLIDE